ncbi:MAG: hypothetical protein FWE74_01050 [Oscillospiraceae bacterium]|nr:hypothetical protein [Oscillospiraceae bacterium]
MKELLDELYNIVNSEEYRSPALSKMSEAENVLNENLSEKDLPDFISYVDAVDDYMAEQSILQFKNGFKTLCLLVREMSEA